MYSVPSTATNAATPSVSVAFFLSQFTIAPFQARDGLLPSTPARWIRREGDANRLLPHCSTHPSVELVCLARPVWQRENAPEEAGDVMSECCSLALLLPCLQACPENQRRMGRKVMHHHLDPEFQVHLVGERASAILQAGILRVFPSHDVESEPLMTLQLVTSDVLLYEEPMCAPAVSTEGIRAAQTAPPEHLPQPKK